MASKFRNSDIAFLRFVNQRRPTEPPPRLISEYVEKRRVLPEGTPFPGPWRNYRTPYSIEPMDNMSPFSPVTITSIMKAAQLGLTAMSENVTGYWMDALPAEILFVSATEELLEKWVTKRLEPLIDSIGMRSKICMSVNLNKKSKKTGDKTFSKLYIGGALNMASARSAGNLRSDTKRILILDEIDGAPRMLTTGEGCWLDVVYARTNAWDFRKKILEFSTPTTWDDSLIKERFELGDQRYYHVRCPRCRKLDKLEFKNLRASFRAKILEAVWYECPHCHGKIHNHEKTEMMAPENGAKWVPTAVPSQPGHRSYHISSMYSPVGMLTWKEMYQKYIDAKGKPEKMRSFVNLYLGLPYREQGSRPKVENVIKNRGEYLSGKVPDGVLFLTAGVDMQRGSENDPLNPARLEMEIVGHGRLWRTWSIDYKIFEGPTTESAYTGAWAALQRWASEGGLEFFRSDGFKFVPRIILIDSGDGVYHDIVFAFASQWRNTFASKGFGSLIKRKNEKEDLDPVGPGTFKRYRFGNSGGKMGNEPFVEIGTNIYKSSTYTNLAIERRDFEPQRPGFCDFPRDYGEKYFLGLTAEEKRRDGSFHAGGRRNEPLDCRVMSLCGADIFLNSRVEAIRTSMKKAGRPDLEIAQIKAPHVLNLLEQQTQRKLAA